MKNKLRKNHIFKLVLAITIIVLISFPVFGKEMKPSPNYLIILVHGIGEKNGVFEERGYGNFYTYLTNSLGLDGYVYRFAIKDPYASNILAAKQIGRRTNAETWTYDEKEGKYNNISYSQDWLDSARDQFIDWYYNKYKYSQGYRSKKDVPELVVPKKYIIIAHSMGGNGRGDVVVNGIYPFEVVAKLGDRTVSGRGKIAVLK